MLPGLLALDRSCVESLKGRGTPVGLVTNRLKCTSHFGDVQSRNSHDYQVIGVDHPSFNTAEDACFHSAVARQARRIGVRVATFRSGDVKDWLG